MIILLKRTYFVLHQFVEIVPLWSDSGVRAVLGRLEKIRCSEIWCVERRCVRARERIVGEVLLLLMEVVLLLLWRLWNVAGVLLLRVRVCYFVDGAVRFTVFVYHRRACFDACIAYLLNVANLFAIAAFVVVGVEISARPLLSCVAPISAV
jgi:hypothetical protein